MNLKERLFPDFQMPELPKSEFGKNEGVKKEMRSQPAFPLPSQSTGSHLLLCKALITELRPSDSIA